jgi:hypothetical protein
VLRLGRPVTDIVRGAGIFESLRPETFAIGDGFLDERCGRTASSWRGELDAVVSQNGAGLVGTASISRDRKLRDVAVLALSWRLANANLLVRSVATNM